jgi:hypothetical protein
MDQNGNPVIFVSPFNAAECSGWMRMKVTHCLSPDFVEDEFAVPPQTIVARGKPKAKLRAPFLSCRAEALAEADASFSLGKQRK